MVIDFALTPPIPVAVIVGATGVPLRRVAFETTERPVTEMDESELRSGEELASAAAGPPPASTRPASEDEGDIDVVGPGDLGSRLDIRI